MSEPAVEIVQLEEQKVWLVLAYIVVWRQVNRHVDLALDDADQVQVLLDLLNVYWHFIELGRLRSQTVLLYVQVEDVEQGQSGTERVVKVLHSLVLRGRDLHVRVEKLNDVRDPGEDLRSQ